MTTPASQETFTMSNQPQPLPDLQPTVLTVQERSFDHESNQWRGPGRGGHMAFTSGRGGLSLSDHTRGPHGSIIFSVPAPDEHMPPIEALRLDPDGSAWVYGRQVATDVEVYEAFRAWVLAATTAVEEGFSLERRADGALTPVRPKE